MCPYSRQCCGHHGPPDDDPNQRLSKKRPPRETQGLTEEGQFGGRPPGSGRKVWGGDSRTQERTLKCGRSGLRGPPGRRPGRADALEPTALPSGHPRGRRAHGAPGARSSAGRALAGAQTSEPPLERERKVPKRTRSPRKVAVGARDSPQGLPAFASPTGRLCAGPSSPPSSVARPSARSDPARPSACPRTPLARELAPPSPQGSAP